MRLAKFRTWLANLVSGGALETSEIETAYLQTCLKHLEAKTKNEIGELESILRMQRNSYAELAKTNDRLIKGIEAAERAREKLSHELDALGGEYARIMTKHAALKDGLLPIAQCVRPGSNGTVRRMAKMVNQLREAMEA